MSWGWQGAAGADPGSITVRVAAGAAYEVEQRIVVLLHLVRAAVRLRFSGARRDHTEGERWHAWG